MARIDSPLVRFSLALTLTAPLGCGPAEPPRSATALDPVKPSATEAPPASASPESRSRKRLQGTWEIVRYVSADLIPDEAMPLMSELFNSLRLQFDGTAVIARLGNGSEERTGFSVVNEQGDSFTLIAKGGMFDGARCRFTANDELEVSDTGDTWAGTSTLRRVR